MLEEQEDNSEYIVFRITDNGQFTQEEIKEFHNRHPNVISIKEFKTYNPDEGPHYHGWTKANIHKKTLIGYITKELHCKGNGDYSVSQKEVKSLGSISAYQRYCCKGECEGKHPTDFFNTTPDFILSQHTKYYHMQREIIKVRRDANRKKLAALSEYVEDKIMFIYEGKMCYIPEVILEYHKEKDLLVSDSQVEQYYNYIRTKFDSGYLKERANRIYGKIHRFLN